MITKVIIFGVLHLLLASQTSTYAAGHSRHFLQQSNLDLATPAQAPSPITLADVSSPAPSSEPPAPQPPLASLGPRPAPRGASVVVTLDMWGSGLLTFDIGQQQALLLVMNQTIEDAQEDELTLVAVEDILPLDGPAAVSVYSNSDNSSRPPVNGRKLLGVGRVLLQAPTNAIVSAGNATNISSLPHLQAVVRISAAPNQVEIIETEVRNAVAGPMLRLLNEQGLGIKYMALTGLSVDFGTGQGPRPTAADNGIDTGAIAGIVVAGSIVILGTGLGYVYWKRKQKQRNLRDAIPKAPDSASSQASVDISGNTSNSNTEQRPLNWDSMLLSGNPVFSLSSSLNASSGASAQSRKVPTRQNSPNGQDTSLWNVPFMELQFSRVIGEGSFGKVFLGKWQETTVAIKILTAPGGPLPDDSWDVQDLTQLKDCSWSPMQGASTSQRLLIEELRKEALLMASLRHPNVVLFLGVCVEPPCMVTEFCARGSLLDVLHRARTNKAVAQELDWRRRLRLALDAAKGMNYLHSRTPPIIHRDLKSANLLVDKHWQAKVADFNLSRVMHPQTAVSSVAATNPRWLPPEVLLGNGYDASADVYAFGIILWELMSWQLPWQEETPWQVVISVVDHDQRPEIPSDEELPGGLPAAADAYLGLMKKCWATNPKERPTYEVVIGEMRTLIDAEDLEIAKRLKSEAVAIVSHQQQNQLPIAQENPIRQAVQPSQRPVSPFIQVEMSKINVESSNHLS